MKSVFNKIIIALFAISTVIAGTKGGTIEEKLALEAQRVGVQKEKISIQDSRVCINKTSPIIIDTRDYMEGFEGEFPPAGWTHEASSTYTWELGNYSPYEGLYYASTLYDPSLAAQNEWLRFTHTITEEEQTLQFAALASVYWGCDPNPNYDLLVTIDGVEVWNFCDDGSDVSYVWENAFVSLNAYIGQTVEIGFGYVGSDGAQGSFDAVQITGAIVSGCTDPNASNYNPDAIADDGSCEYISGCTDSNASNYNPDAYIDDGHKKFMFLNCYGHFLFTGIWLFLNCLKFINL